MERDPGCLGVVCDSENSSWGTDPCFRERLSVAYPEGRYRARILQHVFVGDRFLE